MNYYKELLDSYSKLKKRSLKLYEEAEAEGGGEVNAIIMKIAQSNADSKSPISIPHPNIPSKNLSGWVVIQKLSKKPAIGDSQHQRKVRH